MGESRSRARRRSARSSWTWEILTAELLLLLAATGVLLLVAGRLPNSDSEAAFVYLLVLGVHTRAVVRYASGVAEFLALECPTCLASFHGYPDEDPRPFRKECAHCGVRLFE